MSTAYLYDGEEYDTEEDCIRAIVESTYECDDEFWTWMDDVYSASDMYCIIVDLLNNMRTKARAEDFRTDILDRYAETICEDFERVRTMLETHEVEIIEEE